VHAISDERSVTEPGVLAVALPSEAAPRSTRIERPEGQLLSANVQAKPAEFMV
jgi:hypothetical protein